MDDEIKRPRVVKANRLLQAKVGMGPDVDDKLVEKSQRLIDSNKIDFAPMAAEYLDALGAAIKDGRSGQRQNDDLLQDMVDPVMQLKANAGMFNYQLVSTLANIMLNFLETVEKIDRDVIDIVDVHYKTLVILIGNQMKGDGGEYGTQLKTELKDACKRYFAKQASKGNAIEDKDAFFIDN